MNTDFEKLLKTKHMFEWLSNEPFEMITSTIEQMYIEQSPTTKMLEFKTTSEPEWLTGGRKTEDDNDVILVRTGVSVACDFTLQDNSGVYNLSGILTWVGTNLDAKPKTRMWMDLDGTLSEFGMNGLLDDRIYELDNVE